MFIVNYQTFTWLEVMYTSAILAYILPVLPQHPEGDSGGDSQTTYIPTKSTKARFDPVRNWYAAEGSFSSFFFSSPEPKAHNVSL